MKILQRFTTLFNRWDSVVTRITALVAGILIISFLLHLILINTLLTFISNDMSQIIGQMVRNERSILVDTPPEKRNQIAAKLSNEKHHIRRSTAEHSRLDKSKNVINFIDDLGTGSFFRKIQNSVGNDIKVNLNPPPNIYIIFSFYIENEHWEIVHELQSPIIVAISGLIGWVTLITCAVLISSIIGIRLISRPLRDLSEQLVKQSGKPNLLYIPESATSEIKEVIKAFNEMKSINIKSENLKRLMLAGISHDLRTPLTRLHFRVEMNSNVIKAKEFEDDLLAVEHMLKQFLEYTKGEITVELGEPWQLNEVVSSVVSSYSSIGVNVIFKGYESIILLPDIAAERIVTNLIDNAIEYGKGPIEVTITNRINEKSDCVQLTVWDNGKGITHEEFELAKQPFKRLNSRSNQDGHCGLGLAIVAQIAEQTKGVLELARDDANRFGIAIFWQV